MRPLSRSVLLLLFLGLLTFVGCKKATPPPAPEDPPAPPPVAQAPFDLSVEPASVQLTPGEQTKVKVTVRRSHYDGPIGVELVNLPAGMRAPQATIPPGQSQVEIDLSATEQARAIERNDLQVFGYARDAGNRQVASPNFRLVVAPLPELPLPPQAASFDLRIEPAAIRLEPGEKATLRVTVVRHNFQGPVLVELVNLPAHLNAPRAVIAEGRNSVDIDVLAAANAAARKANVHALGSAMAGITYQAPSQAVVVQVVEPVKAKPVTFDLTLEPAVVRVTQGEKARVRVVAARRGYDGPITVELVNLPAHVEAPKGLIARGQNFTDIEMTAGDRATAGPANVAALGTALEANNLQVAASPAAFSVLPAPPPAVGPQFDLRVDDAFLRLKPGGSGTVRVTALRNGYQGPISVELTNLPAHVTASRAIIGQGRTTADIDVTAGLRAEPGDRRGISVLGTAVQAANVRATSNNFTLTVAAAAPAGPPFELRIDPTVVRLGQGEQAKVRVTAQRKNYQGPISVELRNLPTDVEARKGVITAGQTFVDIELSSAANAKPLERSNVVALGKAINADNQEVASPGFTVSVMGKPFDLRVEPAVVRLSKGDKAKVRVTAERKNYDGAISVELRNLPLRVTAEKDVIPRGKSFVDVELTAGANASPADRADVLVVGTPSVGGGQPISSPQFRVLVQDVSFDLRVEPKVVKLGKDDKGKVRVTATRQGYDGPIAVELRNLPPQVKASREVIAKNQTSVEIDILADPKADSSERNNVHAVGSATAGPNLQVVSPNFTLIVQGAPAVKPAIEVRVQPQQVKLSPGGSMKIKVTVARKNYEGPIGIELGDLPAGVTASKAIIPAGQDSAQVELAAGPKAPAGSKDVKAAGTMLAAPNLRDVSPAFTVIVGKK